MKNRLRFDLKLASHPYPEEATSPFEAWGSLFVFMMTNSKQIPLLQTQWNLALLAEWFIENQTCLRYETLSLNGKSLVLPSESLAQALKRLQGQDFSMEEAEEEQWFDQLFQFRQHHSLRFALRGANIPEIIIGCNHGAGEISLSSKEDKWAYPFDLDDFLRDLQQQLEHVLMEWTVTTQNTSAHHRTEGILQKLREATYV